MFWRLDVFRLSGSASSEYCLVFELVTYRQAGRHTRNQWRRIFVWDYVNWAPYQGTLSLSSPFLPNCSLIFELPSPPSFRSLPPDTLSIKHYIQHFSSCAPNGITNTQRLGKKLIKRKQMKLLRAVSSNPFSRDHYVVWWKAHQQRGLMQMRKWKEKVLKREERGCGGEGTRWMILHGSNSTSLPLFLLCICTTSFEK